MKSGSSGRTRWVCKPCPTAGMDKENLNTRRAKLGALHLLLCSMLSMRGLGGSREGMQTSDKQMVKVLLFQAKGYRNFPKNWLFSLKFTSSAHPIRCSLRPVAAFWAQQMVSDHGTRGATAAHTNREQSPASSRMADLFPPKKREDLLQSVGTIPPASAGKPKQTQDKPGWPPRATVYLVYL